MPRFNYENPTNVAGKGMGNEEDVLFECVISELAFNGYKGMTLAGLKKLPKLEGNTCLAKYRRKDALVQAAIDDFCERIECTYKPITEDAVAYLAGHDYNRDANYRELERLLYRHIYICVNPKNRIYMLVAGNESMLPPLLSEQITKCIQKNFTQILTDLILLASEVKNRQTACLAAASACGSINFLVSQPKLCEKIYKGLTNHEPNYAEIEDYINNYILRSISINTAINKPF